MTKQFVENIYFPSILQGTSFELTDSNISLKLSNSSFTPLTKINTGLFKANAGLTNINLSQVSSVNEEAFLACVNLSNFSIPKLSSIPNYGFQETGLKSIYDLSGNIKTLGENCFNNCPSLSFVFLSSCASIIGGAAFGGCEVLSTLALPILSEYNSFTFDFGYMNNLTTLILSGKSGSLISFFDFSYLQSHLQSVMINGVTILPSSAFQNFSKLTTINFPSVNSIGSYCFLNCYSLQQAVFSNVSNLNPGIFYNCYSLNLTSFHSTLSVIPSSCFYNCSSLSYFSFSKITYVGANAFTNCKSLSNLISFYSTVSLNTNAFDGCPNIKSFTALNIGALFGPSYSWVGSISLVSFRAHADSTIFPCFKNGKYKNALQYLELTGIQGVQETTSVYSNTFMGYSNLSYASINLLTRIPNGFFESCYKLRTFYPGNTLIYAVGSSAFETCYSLSSIPNVNGSIGDRAFMYCSSLSNFNFSYVSSIGNLGMAYCSKLSSANLYNCSYLGNAAFMGCSSLREITLRNLQSYGEQPFYFNNMPLLSSLSFNSIAWQMFARDNLNSTSQPLKSTLKYLYVSGISSLSVNISGYSTISIISMPNLTYIADNVMNSMSSLQTFNAGQLIYIGDRAFCGAMNLRWNSSICYTSTIGLYTFGWCHNLGSTLRSFPNCSRIYGSAFQLASTSTYLRFGYNLSESAYGECYSWAFYQCSTITSVRLDNYIRIGSYAFRDCSNLTSITCQQAYAIHEYAFYNCSKLISVGWLSEATFINHGAFLNCSALSSLAIGSKTMTSQLGPHAKYYCGFISSYAFNGCTNLSTLTIYATAAIYSLSESLYTFSGTPIANGTGRIYVPSVLYSQYRTASNWSRFASRIYSFTP